MSDNKINPEKLTKPIQLLAAWLVGLLSISSCFLFAAVNLATQWQSGLLVIAAVINVPLFLIAVFLLQTKFRPELQEDSYYSTYLSNKSNTIIKVSKTESNFNEVNAKLELLEQQLESLRLDNADDIQSPNSYSDLIFGVNHHLEDSAEIKSVLASKSVLKVSRFGPPDMVPSHRVMSISRQIPGKTQDELILLAKELGMEGYNFFDNYLEQTEEDVLIGSYGELGYDV